MVHILAAFGGHGDGAAAGWPPAADGAVLLPDQDRIFRVVRRTNRGQWCRVRVYRRRASLFRPRWTLTAAARTKHMPSVENYGNIL